MNNISVHGGEIRDLGNIAIDNSKSKINKSFKDEELNILDQNINNSFELHRKLMNDVHETDELKINSAVIKTKEDLPTTVTLANVYGGKKSREKKYKDLKVLIDTGCSHSIINKKYCRGHKLNKKKRKYATGSGTLITQAEAKVDFSLPEIVIKK